MGIKAIPVPIQGDSHSVPFQFPIVSSIPIPMGFPMVIYAVNIERHHCLVFTCSLVFCTIVVNELYSLSLYFDTSVTMGEWNLYRLLTFAPRRKRSRWLQWPLIFSWKRIRSLLCYTLKSPIQRTSLFSTFLVGPYVRYVAYDNRIVVQRHWRTHTQ